MLRDRQREKTVTAKTFENILFLAEIFGEKADQEIPKVPMLELREVLNCPTLGWRALRAGTGDHGRCGNNSG
jgi:hypothetical protein